MDLQDYRRELDGIDSELLRLFTERMEISAQIADYKRAHGLRVVDIYREAAMLERLEGRMPEGLKGYVTALYSTILELSRARQERKNGQGAENVILIGMPGCGKRTLGRLLAARLGRSFISSDLLVESLAGLTIPEFFRRFGEDSFRALETRSLALSCIRSGNVIATGGGCVTRPENHALLRMGGKVVWLRRDAGKLAREYRPLTITRDLNVVLAEREPMYRSCADCVVDNDGTPEQTVRKIINAIS